MLEQSQVKTFPVNDLCTELKVDCMFLTETWLSSDCSVAFFKASPRTTAFHTLIRKGKKGVGTASIITNALSCKDISFGDFGSFEHHAILFKCQPPVPCIGHQSTALLSLLISLNYCLLSLRTMIKSLCWVILIFMLTKRLTPRSLNLFILIQHATGPTNNRGHTLDLVIAKGLSIGIPSIVDIALSDHHCVLFTTLLSLA